MYRSRTVFEDATPEIVRDFFWDDDFRLKWDPMLSYFELLEELPCTGTSIVHWIKKVRRNFTPVGDYFLFRLEYSLLLFDN